MTNPELLLRQGRAFLGIYRAGFFHAKRVEPRKRNKGDGLQWIVHRFPIKGGISLNDAMLIDFCRPNPLLKLPVRRGPRR